VILAVRALDTSPTTLSHAGSESSQLSNVWWIMFGLAIVVYLVVGGLIILASVRGRHRDDPIDGPNRLDDYFIWIGGLIVPALILLFIAFLTVHTGAALRTPQKNELNITVVGEQWWWRVSYPGTNVETANEIHVPVGQPLAIAVLSDNVIHSFWVPQLAGKEDMIPGQRNVLRFTVRKAGTYRGQCAEFCGVQHAKMAFTVIAQSPGEYQIWLQHEEQIAAVPQSELAARGELALTTAACAGCHTVRNTDAKGTRGPDLSDMGSRATIGAGTLENTPGNLRAWIKSPGHFKPGVLMPPATISSDDVQAIAAYLEELK
jgi:cytochrome c oxidase subunit 2